MYSLIRRLLIMQVKFYAEIQFVSRYLKKKKIILVYPNTSKNFLKMDTSETN